MGSHRLQRVADEIRAALSETMLRRMSDPRVRLATIAAVDLSPDLRHARVHVGSLAGAEARSEAVDGLNRAARFLRRELGRSLRLKYLPELSFVPDAQEDRAARIERTLDELRDEPHAGDDE